MDLHEVYRNSGLGKWFHGESANKTPGWDRYNSEGEMVGECGDADKGAAYSACLSKQKAQKLGKEGIASFVKRKRAAQSEAGRGKKGAGGKGQKPINVDTGASKMDECVECNDELELINEGKNKPNDPEKWSDCKSAAKSKFDVYPSAYANAWAAKCYKKKGGSWSSVKEEVQQLTKDNIVTNILESKMKDGPGKTSQRPKSWNKGTKSGSEKRKMREEGKREVRDMSEGIDDFFSTNANGVTRGLDRNYGVEDEDDVTHPHDMVHSTHFEPVDWQDRSKGIKAREGSPVAIHGIPVHLLDTGTLLPRPEAEAEFAKLPNAMKYLRDVKRSHWDSYNWATGAARKGLKGARRAAAMYTKMGISAKSLMERIRTGQISPPQTGNLSEQTIETRLRNAMLESLENREQKIMEGGSWGPEVAGAAQDDMTAAAYADQDKQRELQALHAAAQKSPFLMRLLKMGRENIVKRLTGLNKNIPF